MRERAGAVDARLDIATGSGRGTVITVEWPWGKREALDE